MTPRAALLAALHAATEAALQLHAATEAALQLPDDGHLSPTLDEIVAAARVLLRVEGRNPTSFHFGHMENQDDFDRLRGVFEVGADDDFVHESTDIISFSATRGGIRFFAQATVRLSASVEAPL